MTRFSQAYVIAEEDAENIVQDIFLYLWEHPEVFRTIDNMDAFLFTLVKNRCLNFLKHSLYINEKKRTLETAEEKEMQMNLYSLQQFDESFLTISEVENLIDEVIGKLPERCREIFILSRMEGLKYKEIAERLDISVNTVENQMSIALRKLKVELKDYLPLLLFIV
ncbi:RNA polymerase sigma-70 factor [Parabacteroides sp. AM58-2XD]|nr:RNA polymerase sigma-70 factor [Parabacteroides sp. AM58-2XD]